MVIQLFSIGTGPPLVLFLLERVWHSRVCLRCMNLWQVIQKIFTTPTTSSFSCITRTLEQYYCLNQFYFLSIVIHYYHQAFFTLAWFSHSELTTFSQISLLVIVRKHLEQQESAQFKISCEVCYKKLASKRIKVSKFVNNLHFINQRKCVTFPLLELKHLLGPERKEVACRALEKSVECVCSWLHLELSEKSNWRLLA